LHQHLPDLTTMTHRQTAEPFDPTHAVWVHPGTPLHRLTGRNRLDVNSFHHQAIDELGERLVGAADAPDGMIEAVFDPELRFGVGVQWHAELLTHRPEHTPLLQELVTAASSAATPLRIAA
jgi:putative glutamine amidotransferase